jgi:3-hydroxybutyryl-CoA dehydrogenase
MQENGRGLSGLPHAVVCTLLCHTAGVRLQKSICAVDRPAPPADQNDLPSTLCPAASCVQVCASKGLDVLLMDRHKDLLERGIVGIKKSLRRLNEKGSVTKEAAEETIGRIRTETTLDVSAHMRRDLRSSLAAAWSCMECVLACWGHAQPCAGAAQTG